jgi:hypothetical protein
MKIYLTDQTQGVPYIAKNFSTGINCRPFQATMISFYHKMIFYGNRW